MTQAIRLVASTIDELKETIQLAPIAIAHLTIDGVIIYVNEEACRLLGYSEDEYLKTSSEYFVHPDDAASELRGMNSLIAEAITIFSTEARYRRKTGEFIWVKLQKRLIRDQRGAPKYFNCCLLDISAEKRNEQMLLHSQNDNLLRKMVNSLPVLLAYVDSELRYRIANMAYEKWFNLSPSELYGKSIEEVVGSKAFQIIKPYLMRAVSGEIVQFEASLPYSSINQREVSVTYVPDLDSRGRPLGIIVLVQDISKTKATHRLLEERQQQVIFSAKLAALGEMAAGMAHEINNPLAIIHAHASRIRELVTSKKIEMEKLSQACEKIERTTERIAKIVKALRVFASDEAAPNPVSASLADIVSDTLELCRERFRSHGVELKVTHIPADIRIACHPVQISQVLLNVLNNAFDAVEPSAQKWIEISFLLDEGEVQILVSDSGRRIDDKVADKLFQPFFTTKPIGRGMGLGLSISRGIIQAHNGELRLDRSASNTRFVITLPRAQAEHMAA